MEDRVEFCVKNVVEFDREGNFCVSKMSLNERLERLW
jgi:hypothetical protein